MKNLFKFIAISILTSFTLLYSCQKEESTLNTSPSLQKSQESLKKSNSSVREKDNVLGIETVEKYEIDDNFKEKIQLSKIEKRYGKIKNMSAEKTTFRGRDDIAYIMIPFESSGKSLYIYVNSKGKKSPFIFESNFKDSKNGTFYIRDIDDNIVVKEVYINGKISKTDKNAKVGVLEEPSPCYKCITKEYNAMKSGCESDPICDISCDIMSTVCKSTWFTLGLATCTSGSCSPNCPCNPF